MDAKKEKRIHKSSKQEVNPFLTGFLTSIVFMSVFGFVLIMIFMERLKNKQSFEQVEEKVVIIEKVENISILPIPDETYLLSMLPKGNENYLKKQEIILDHINQCRTSLLNTMDFENLNDEMLKKEVFHR